MESTKTEQLKVISQKKLSKLNENIELLATQLSSDSCKNHHKEMFKKMLSEHEIARDELQNFANNFAKVLG